MVRWFRAPSRRQFQLREFSIQKTDFEPACSAQFRGRRPLGRFPVFLGQNETLKCGVLVVTTIRNACKRRRRIYSIIRISNYLNRTSSFDARRGRLDRFRPDIQTQTGPPSKFGGADGGARVSKDFDHPISSKSDGLNGEQKSIRGAETRRRGPECSGNPQAVAIEPKDPDFCAASSRRTFGGGSPGHQFRWRTLPEAFAFRTS